MASVHGIIGSVGGHKHKRIPSTTSDLATFGQVDAETKAVEQDPTGRYLRVSNGVLQVEIPWLKIATRVTVSHVCSIPCYWAEAHASKSLERSTVS